MGPSRQVGHSVGVLGIIALMADHKPAVLPFLDMEGESLKLMFPEKLLSLPMILVDCCCLMFSGSVCRTHLPELMKILTWKSKSTLGSVLPAAAVACHQVGIRRRAIFLWR